MSSTGIAYGSITLQDTDRTALMQLGRLKWDIDKIAIFFGWDKGQLKAELSNPESEISILLKHGELQACYEMENKMLEDAKDGNYTAAKQLSDIMRDRTFQMSKLDLFGGAEDETIFSKIHDYIEKGCPGDLSGKEQLYIDTLQMIYSLSIKFGDRKTIRFLTREPIGFSYERAKEMMSEAIELFNGGRQTSKAAMRHHIAESYDTLYHMVLENAKTTQDIAMAASLLDRKAKILQLDKPDEEAVDPKQYGAGFRLLSLTPESIGLPAANRDRLAALIDSMEIPDVEAKRLKQEAQIEDTDIIKMIGNVIQEES